MKDQTNWRSVWQMTNGLHQDTAPVKVRSKLLEVKADLLEGLLQFKPKTSGSDSKLEKLLKDGKQEKLFPFTKLLQTHLNVDADQTWSTLCSYLLHEYKGSPGSISIYVSNDANKWKLIADIWNYYSLERMIILKLIKNMLEFQHEKRHPYHVIYSELIDTIGLTALKDKIIEQLQVALKDDPDSSASSKAAMDQHQELNKIGKLYGRTLREINELLHLLLIIVDIEGTGSPEEFKRFLEMFKGSPFLQKCKFKMDCDVPVQMQRIEHSRVLLLLMYCHFCPIDFRKWNASTLKSVDETVSGLQQSAENGPILLAWMIKNFAANSVDDTLNDTRNYQSCGAKAIKLDVFKYLWTILISPTYQNKPANALATTARRIVYKMLDELCHLFDGDGSVAQHHFIYDLLAELLTTPSIAVDFIKAESDGNRGGCVSLYNTAIELFPNEFVAISKIAAALTSSGTKIGSGFVKTQLESLPVYSELCTGKEYPLLSSGESEEEFLLTKDYYPMRQFALKIPSGTRVAIMDRQNATYVHFWHTCNYFHVLHNDIKELLYCGDANRENVLTARVNSGIIYLLELLKKLKSPTDISDAMVHPVELVFDILLKFKSVQSPPIVLLSSCLNVCAALSSFFDQEVLKRVLNLGIFPTLSSASFSPEDYARGTGFDSGLIGQYLIRFETGCGSYPFLKSYFAFLSANKAASNSSLNVFDVELPALIFMLREIFPHCQTWRFEKEAELYEIYEFVMEYFFEVLQIEDGGGGGDRKLLRDTCVYSLLNLENGLTLLKFVGIGNPFLQSKMEEEANWSAAMSSGLNKIVQLSMTILMQILRKKAFVPADKHTLSPLETVIYTQPKQRDTLRIIPVVTSYMNNVFNKRLPILSCRLLRRFAIEFQMSLLACLDMQQDHIRMTFLQRLRDDTGSVELKIAILEFVEACLNKQPGLVEAFFGVRYENEKKRPKHTDGIPAYMEEYLEAISKDPAKVASPLLTRIMSLFHVVWRNNMQSLIRDLVEGDSFWPSLSTPLFTTINVKSLKVYSQLFNILGLEVFKYQSNELSAALEKTLRKFFDLSSFTDWLKYLLDCGPEEAMEYHVNGVSMDETPEWLCRMQSFKDFLCIVVKRKPELISSKTRCLLLNRLLGEILKRIEEVQNNRCDSRALVILAELYLVVLVNSKTPKYTDNVVEDKRLFQDIAMILSFLASSYDDVIPRVRAAILGFSTQIVLLYDGELYLHPNIGTSIVQSTVAMICEELSWVERGLSGDKGGDGGSVSLLLCLQLLQKLLMINNENRFFDWETVAVGHKILYRFLASLQRNCQRFDDRKLTVVLLEVLTSIARTMETNEFLFCDVGDYLWLKLLPPKTLLRDPFQSTGATAAATVKPEDWVISQWWPVYGGGIELVTVLLQKHGSLFVQQAISFLGIHEEYLMDAINLVRNSLEPRAMHLIKRTVALICECTRYRKTWGLEHPQSLSNLMRSIQILTEQLISLIYRPNLLKMLLEGGPGANDNGLVDLSVPITATPELVTAMNGVVEIVIACTKSLLAFSPPLLELICSPTLVLSQWHTLIEIQFGAPKFNESIQQLSFGTLLSAVGTFTKTLGLGMIQLGNPLNFSQGEVSGGASVLLTSTSPSATRGVYNRTSSVGNQSLTSNCNEILSNLDGKLCMVALEYILTLLLSQSYLALKDNHLSVREKQMIKRELSAELGILNEFLKKKLAMEHIGTLYRKKHGSTPILNEVGDMGQTGSRVDNKSQSTGHQQQQRKLSNSRDSMRVNVVRRLHLQQKVLGSTPHKEAGQSSFDANLTPIKRFDPRRDADIEYMDMEEPTDIGLSTVKVVDSDYLHILSNVFAVMCHSEK